VKIVKSWRFIALLAILGLIVVGNLTNRPAKLPFYSGYQLHQVNQMIEDMKWVEAAPVVLKNHFQHVHVTNVGKVTEKGFGFQNELVQIFHVDSVDRSQNPIDVRGKIAKSQLNEYQQYPSGNSIKGAVTHCAGRDSKYCSFAIYWDNTFPTTSANFVGVQLLQNGYALVEKSLLEKLLGSKID
jgi:hypothetical protein